MGTFRRTSSWHVVIAAAGFMAMTSMATPARADEPPGEARSPAELGEARRLFREAVESDRALDPAGALVLYERARAIAVSPQLLFNIGSCQERLGRLLDAARSYGEAEVEANARHNDEVARESRARLDQLAKSTPRLRVALPTDAKTIDVRLDDKPVDVTDALRVDPGDHRLVARSEDDRTFELSFRANENEERNIDVRFGASSGGDAPVAERVVFTRPPKEPPSYLPAVIAGGATVVLGTVAAITFASGRSKKERFDELNAGPTPGSLDERQQLKDDGQALYVTSTVFGIGAALAGGATIYLFLRAALAPRTPATTSIAPTTSGFRLGGSF